MTRTGKIARMPKDIRDEVCKRLMDGHPAQDIAAWLNEQPAVKAVLDKEFEGEPINHTNMHWWAKGGYLEWKRNIERSSNRGEGLAFLLNKLNLVKRVTPPDMADDVALLLATSIGAECIRIEGIEDVEERIVALNGLIKAFAQYRGAELDGGKLHLDQQKLENMKQDALKRQMEIAQSRKRTPEETQAVIRRILSTD